MPTRIWRDKAANRAAETKNTEFLCAFLGLSKGKGVEPKKLKAFSADQPYAGGNGLPGQEWGPALPYLWIMFLHSSEPQIYLPTQTQHLGEDTSMKSVHISRLSGKDHRIESWKSCSGKGFCKCNPLHPSTSPRLQQPWEYLHRSAEQDSNTCL